MALYEKFCAIVDGLSKMPDNEATTLLGHRPHPGGRSRLQQGGGSSGTDCCVRGNS